MTKALEPVLFVPDAHHPYADVTAWTVMMTVAKVIKPKHIVIIGDFLDCESVSFHAKDPRRPRILLDEVTDAAEYLDELDDLGATNKIWIDGNHEHRLDRYIADRSPELVGMVSLAKALHLRERGWRVTKYRQSTRLGKLWLTHDVGTAGRYATHRALDTFQHSIITGHTHRMCYVVEGNAAGEQKLSASFGWLGDASKINYMHAFNVLKNWTLGFGVGYVDPRSDVCYTTPVPIIKSKGIYTCVVNGCLYAQKEGIGI